MLTRRQQVAIQPSNVIHQSIETEAIEHRRAGQRAGPATQDRIRQIANDRCRERVGAVLDDADADVRRDDHILDPADIRARGSVYGG